MGQGSDLIAIPIYLLVMSIVSLILLGLAILPAIIAFRRQARDRWFILALNLILGATGIGWIIALILACRSARSSKPHSAGRGDNLGVGLLMNDIRRLPIFPQPTNGQPEPLRHTAQASEMVIDAIERLSDLAAKGYLAPNELAALKAKLLSAR